MTLEIENERTAVGQRLDISCALFSLREDRAWQSKRTMSKNQQLSREEREERVILSLSFTIDSIQMVSSMPTSASHFSLLQGNRIRSSNVVRTNSLPRRPLEFPLRITMSTSVEERADLLADQRNPSDQWQRNHSRDRTPNGST